MQLMAKREAGSVTNSQLSTLDSWSVNFDRAVSPGKASKVEPLHSDRVLVSADHESGSEVLSQAEFTKLSLAKAT